MQTQKINGVVVPPQTRFLPGPNPFAAWIGEGHKSFKYVRVTAGSDGIARIENGVDHGSGGEGRVGPFMTRAASAYAVFAAPANHVTPARHVVPGSPELLLLLDGAVTLKCGPASQEVAKGAFIIFENDKGAGHIIEAGPAGYTALKVVFVEGKAS